MWHNFHRHRLLGKKKIGNFFKKCPEKCRFFGTLYLGSWSQILGLFSICSYFYINDIHYQKISAYRPLSPFLFVCKQSIQVGFLPKIVSQEIMHIHGCVTHVSGRTFWARSNGIGFESLRPLQGRHGGLHNSRFWTRRGATPTLKSLRHFQSSELKNKNR